jgi:BirA family biotin operon repressor/biotin-[acetyl-CoA-carboxylase] ligase
LYDGASESELALRWDVPRVRLFDVVGSTLDVAHTEADAGADAGTVILAEAQSAGRGRLGRSWRSEPGAGIWLTLLERTTDITAPEVLALRVGIAAARALDKVAGRQVSLKWPNDLYLGEGKLAGVLIEARWREGLPEWVAVGIGINVRPPASEARAAGLPEGVRRLEVLDALIPGIRFAARRTGWLTRMELAEFEARDMARGRRCVSPEIGVVAGMDETGALLVDADPPRAGRVVIRAGSLVLADQEGQIP